MDKRERDKKKSNVEITGLDDERSVLRLLLCEFYESEIDDLENQIEDLKARIKELES